MVTAAALCVCVRQYMHVWVFCLEAKRESEIKLAKWTNGHTQSKPALIKFLTNFSKIQPSNSNTYDTQTDTYIDTHTHTHTHVT